MKDMPFELPEGLAIGAVPPREDPRDALISRHGCSLADLPGGARVGTSSLRRGAQLAAVRPDLRIESLRGNIDTRLKKLEAGGFDAIVLAAAGLRRMGWGDRITALLDPRECLPAVGQGALAIECRENDAAVRGLLARLNDPRTERAVRAERRLLGLLNGGCQVPIGAYAEAESGAEGAKVRLTAMVASPDGKTLLRSEAVAADPLEAGSRAAEQLLAQGADRILDEARE